MAKKKNRGSTSQTASAAAVGTKAAARRERINARPQLLVREQTGAGKFAWWTLLVLAFVVPFIFGSSILQAFGLTFSDSFDTVKVLILRIGTCVALAAWIIDIVVNGGEIRVHKVYWVVLALMVWIGISTVVSVSPATAFFGKYRRYDGAWSYLIYFVLFFLTVQYATGAKRVRQLAQSVCWSSLFVAGYGLLQAFGMDYMQWGTLPFEENRSFSSYGNPDLLAGFLAFGLCVSLALALSEKKSKGWRSFYWVVFLLNAAVTITAFSRSIWVAGVVGFALLVFFAIRQKVTWGGVDWGFSGVVVAAVLGFIVRSLFVQDSVMNFATRVKSIFEFGSGSAVTRFEIWDAAGKAIRERPVFGFGPDTFRLVFRRFAPQAYAQDAGYRSVADNVHNFPLQLAAGIGIPGALLFYGSIAWICVLGFKSTLARDEKSSGARLLFAGLLTAVITYNVHLFFGLSLPGTSFLLWMFLGAILVPHTRTVHVKLPEWTRPVAWPAIAACVLLAVPTVYAMRLAMADHYFLLEKQYEENDNTALALAAIEQTMHYNPWLEIYLTDWVTIQSDVAIQAVTDGAANADVEVKQAEDLCDRLVALSPWEYDSYLMVTAFYSRLGEALQTTDPAAAQTYLQKSADIAAAQIKETPDGLALRYTYGLTLRSLGDTDAAIEQLQYCVDHDTNFTDAATALAAIETTGVTTTTTTDSPAVTATAQ
ncbi:MAG: O-antigen ligase family protein [Actinomycetes bacterium]|jgi:O-antigen ligase|nr:O-antigen ligase family protein [Actinomycetes bacterium]